MAMIQGVGKWCKIVGAPHKGYDEGEKNKIWSFDLYIDEPTVAKLVDEGVPHQIRTDEKTGEKFITFKRKAYKQDGTAAKPIAIKDSKAQDWDGETLIGNGSVLNVKYNVNEWTFGKKKGLRADPLAVQVWELVPYEGGEAFPVNNTKVHAAEVWDAEDEE